MPSAYLVGGDPTAYGVPNATAAQVQQASALIDSTLGRPEGLIWSPDGSGNPAWMTNLSPQYALTATAGFSPGQNVVVAATGPGLNTGVQDNYSPLVGEVLIVDRATPSKAEACVVAAVEGANVTLTNVLFAHSADALMEVGLTILEERSMPTKRSVTRVSRGPLMRLVSGMGRYGYGRRSDQVGGYYQDANLIATIQAFGGPPVWVSFDPTQASVSVATSEIWVPSGQLLAYYSDVRLRYVAGYQASGLPSAVKQACANIVAALTAYPELSGGVKSLRAGDTAIERFKATVIDADTMNLLEPFQATVFY